MPALAMFQSLVVPSPVAIIVEEGLCKKYLDNKATLFESVDHSRACQVESIVLAHTIINGKVICSRELITVVIYSELSPVYSLVLQELNSTVGKEHFTESLVHLRHECTSSVAVTLSQLSEM